MEHNPNGIEQQKQLIAFAVTEGADPSQLNHPEVASALRNHESFIGRNQNLLLSQLGKILDLVPSNQNIHEQNITTELAKKIKSTRGHCSGLTTLWLYSKWLQFTQPEKNHGYNHDWFKNTTRIISSWDDKTKLNDGAFIDAQKFASMVDFFQSPKAYQKAVEGSIEIAPLLTLSMLDTNGKTLQQKYAIGWTFTAEQLHALLKEIVHENELVYLATFGTIHETTRPGHAVGIFKHGSYYYFYDSNTNGGEYKSSSLEKIVEFIIAITADNLNNGANPYSIFISVVGDDTTSYTYPQPQEIIASYPPELNKNTLVQNAAVSAIAGNLDSLKLAIDLGLDPNAKLDGIPLFMIMLFDDGGNYINVAVALLKAGADPNILLETENEEVKEYNGSAALSIASKEGEIEIVKILLEDSRTDVDLINPNTGKDALMYAAEAGHAEIVELLLKRVKNSNKKDQLGKTALMLAGEASRKHTANKILWNKYMQTIELLYRQRDI